tara:strand:+ start:384 stop:1358 length:975 start_codon:yes stop_codon:yes gene_type:complete
MSTSNSTVLLSQTTRRDSFSDYICLSAHQVNTLQSRANVASGGLDGFLRSWFVPMPQSISRSSQQKFVQSQTSMGYALQKLQSIGGNRGSAFAFGAKVGEKVSTMGGPLQAPSQVGTAAALGAVQSGLGIVDQSRSVASQFTDQPLVSLSNHEMRYAGSAYKQYDLVYEFVARDPADVIGPSGIIAAAAQLEAFSYPISLFTNSNRDLIATPPMWTLKYAFVRSSGDVEFADIPPLASLGQPKLCYLAQVDVTHDTTSIVTDILGYTYPMFTNLSLRFIEVEPVTRVQPFDGGEDYAVAYGDETTAPRLFTRSEIYTIEDPNAP